MLGFFAPAFEPVEPENATDVATSVRMHSMAGDAKR
jgi:hypothetical protein